MPEGWVSTTLGEICQHPQYGWTTSAVKKVEGLRLLRTTDISRGKVEWGSVPVCSVEPDDSEKYLLRPGDIVVSRAGSVGLSFIVRECPRAAFASYLIRLRPRPPIQSEYVALFLQSPSYWAQVVEESAGIAVQNINATKLSAMTLPMPPLAEQKRIVAKVEELLARVNAARERLARVPAILKRFRQSVLAAACSGRLTSDWREEHSGVGDGHAILRRIARLRDNRTQDSPVARPTELPESWGWTAFGYVLSELRNGISTRPEMEPPGNPILRISAVRPGRVLLDDVRYLSHSDDVIDNYSLRDGDLLFTRYNGSIELLGVCGMVRDVGRRALLYPDKLMRVRFDHSYLLPAFAELFFQAPESRERLMGDAKSSAGQQGVSGKDIKAQPLAVPPIEEQDEIVRRVDGLFALANTIEQRAAGATARTGKLTQAILAEALRGEIVPTEAELARAEGRPYEPASALLTRIRSSRAAEPFAEKRTSRASGGRCRRQEP